MLARRVILPLALALSLGCPRASEPSPSADPLDTPLPLDPGVRITTLANGMTSYVEVNREPADRAVLRLVVDAGSILEDPDQLGLAHFLEHMAFNGTTHFAGNELVTYLESVGTRFGAHLNAHTSFDETVYKLTVPTDDTEVFEKSFLVLEDWAHGIVFDPEEIAKERGVVLEEWRGSQGAGSRMRDALLPIRMQGSPYPERLPIGTAESLKTFEPAALERFYRDWYRPELMAVIAVGDFDPDVVEALIEKHFATIEGPSEPRERTRPNIPSLPALAIGRFADPEITRTTVLFEVNYDAPKGTTHRAYRDTFTEGFATAILQERLADLARQPDAPFSAAGASQGRMAPAEGTWSAVAATEDGRALEGLEGLLTEIERARRHGFSQAELARAKANALQAMQAYYTERDKTSSTAAAEELVRVFTTGESVPGVAYEWELSQRYIPEISLDEVNAVARDWYPDAGRYVQMIQPEREGLELPTEEAIRAVFERVEGAEIAPLVGESVEGPLLPDPPAPGAIVAETLIEPLGITVWTLQNGSRVFLKPTDFQEDQIVFSAWAQGGTSVASDDDWHSAVSATQIVQASGVGSFSALDLSKRLAGVSASVLPFITADHQGLTGRTTQRDLETALTLAHLAVDQPRFDPSKLELLLKNRRAALENRLASPEARFADAVQRVVWQGHPRSVPWTVETLEKVDLERAASFYRERFADSGAMTWMFTGNLDLETLRPLVERYIGSLPDLPDRDETWRDEGARRVEGVVREVVRAGTAERAVYSLTFHRPFDGSWSDRSAVYLLMDILQVRLREVLREELGGTYGVSANAGIETTPLGYITLNIAFQCDPERLEELKAATWEILASARAEAMPSTALDTAKNQSRRGREEAIRSNAFWAEAIPGVLRRGEDPLDLLGYEDRLEAITPEVLQAAAATFLADDQFIEMTLLPE